MLELGLGFKNHVSYRFLLRLRQRSVGSSETIYPTVVPSRHRPTYMLEPKITYPSQAPSEVSWIFRNDLSHGGSFQAPSNLHVRVRVRIQKSPILRRLLLRHRPSRFLLPKRSISSQAPSNFHVRDRVRIRKPPILRRFRRRHRPSRFLLPKRSIPSQAPSNFHGRVRVRIRKPPILQRFLLRHRPSRLLLNSKLTSIPKLP